MAVKKINASACESLLFEIASMAQRTKEILQSEDFGDHGETVRKLEMLENTVCQLGWLADVALTNMKSVMRIYDGNAVKWLTTPSTQSALEMEVQHG